MLSQFCKLSRFDFLVIKVMTVTMLLTREEKHWVAISPTKTKES